MQVTFHPLVQRAVFGVEVCSASRSLSLVAEGPTITGTGPLDPFYELLLSGYVELTVGHYGCDRSER